MNNPNPTPNTSAARERPAALDGLLAHITQRIDQIEAGTLTPHGPRQQTRPGNRAESHGDATKPPTPTHTEVHRPRTAHARHHAEEASDE